MSLMPAHYAFSVGASVNERFISPLLDTYLSARPAIVTDLLPLLHDRPISERI